MSTNTKKVTTSANSIQDVYAHTFSKVKTKGDFTIIEKGVKNLKSLYDREEISLHNIYEHIHQADPKYINNTLQGHCLRKPYGYAGDFELINKLYNLTTSENPRYKVWDEYAQSLVAAHAVRNRKSYFVELVKSLSSSTESYDILNLASGPAKDLLEVYKKVPDSHKLKTTCVDMDPHAIEFGYQVTKDYSEHISFVQENIYRYHSDRKYDLIWSAGLFDYFSDKVFRKILVRIKEWIKPGGTIVIGNFNEGYNPSRDFMELLCDWHLNHRTESQLMELAISAGFSRAAVSIGREERNVNLFLHART